MGYSAKLTMWGIENHKLKKFKAWYVSRIWKYVKVKRKKLLPLQSVSNIFYGIFPSPGANAYWLDITDVGGDSVTIASENLSVIQTDLL